MSGVMVRDVWKSYRRGASVATVLRGIDLDVAHGECVFLVGPSGSGKTTLLSIIGCILTPDRGELDVLGQDVARLDEVHRARFRRRRIGFVFQRHHLIRGLSALDNVCIPASLDARPKAAARNRACELLERVGLGDRVGYDPRRLSVGQCQRVALARALVNDPELILADEPTASLDAANGVEAMRLLRELARDERKTVVVVTHDSRIFSFADRVLRLEDGAMQASLSPEVAAASH